MTNSKAPPRRGGSRRAVGTARVAAIVVVVGLAIAIGVGSSNTSQSSIKPVASPAFSDLPMVTVGPTAIPVATTPDFAPGSASLEPASTPAVEGGIRATRIRIARLHIDLAIIQGDGIEAPIGKAAHYPGSAWPGAGSNVYIYGHARDGMFITLWQAVVGDSIELDLVDGTSRAYAVAQVLPKVPWDAVQYLEPTQTEQLTLQTSTSYTPTAPRFVVIAVPAQ